MIKQTEHFQPGITVKTKLRGVIEYVKISRVQFFESLGWCYQTEPSIARCWLAHSCFEALDPWDAPNFISNEIGRTVYEIPSNE